MTTPDVFPPAKQPVDKAKYRQFLIDHDLDPNLNAEDLQRAFTQKSDAERAQLQSHFRDFLAAL